MTGKRTEEYKRKRKKELEMLVDPPIEQMLPKTACAYELAVLVSQRACQLVDGAQPMVPDSAANMVSLACREVAQGKVVVVPGDHTKEMKVPKTKAAREAERAAQKAREEQESYRRFTASVDEQVAEETAEPAQEIVFETVEADQPVDEYVNEDAAQEASDAE